MISILSIVIHIFSRIVQPYQPPKYARFSPRIIPRDFNEKKLMWTILSLYIKGSEIIVSESTPLSGSAPEVNGVCSGLTPIFHPNFVEIPSVVLV